MSVYGIEVKEQINTNDGWFLAKIDSFSIFLFPADSSLRYVDYIDFNVDVLPSHQEGRVHWNDDDKTLEAGLDQGSALQIGQEIHMRSTNKTGVQIDDGAVVYVSGAQGNRPTIALASDTSATAILTLGVVTQDIIDNGIGYTTLTGLVRGYDTRSFSAGDVLWLGTTPGELVNVRPPAPQTAVTLGVALNSTEEGDIAVRPVVVQRLATLSDVDARGKQSNWDMLYWRSDSLKWDLTEGKMNLYDLDVYADNAAAISGGLDTGDLYRTATGQVMIVYTP
jgi:hypothetical protein